MSMMVLLLAAGAAMRLTRLITKDTIFDSPRMWVINLVPRGWWLKLWTCPPCMSMWVGALVAAWATLCSESPWFTLPALALTLSQAVVLVAVSIDRD